MTKPCTVFVPLTISWFLRKIVEARYIQYNDKISFSELKCGAVKYRTITTIGTKFRINREGALSSVSVSELNQLTTPTMKFLVR